MRPNSLHCRAALTILLAAALLSALPAAFPGAASGQEASRPEVVEVERELQQVIRRMQANAERILRSDTDAETRDELQMENEALGRRAAGLRARLERMTGDRPPAPPELRSAGPVSSADADEFTERIGELDRHLEEVVRKIRANAAIILAPWTDDETRDELFQENEMLSRYAAGLRARRERLVEAQREGRPPPAPPVLPPTPELGAPEVSPTPELRAAVLDSSAVVDAMLEVYPRFAELQERERRDTTAPLGEEWYAVARDLAAFEPIILRAAQDGKLTGEQYGEFGLRTLLLLGKARLYASAAWFRHPPPGRPRAYLEPYRRGVETLERVISLASDDIERLPMFRRPGPREFLDVVGVRKTDALGVIGQHPTSVAARRTLQDFCPWGRQVLLTLEEADLLPRQLHEQAGEEQGGMDLSILRPYGGDGVLRMVDPAGAPSGSARKAPKTWERRLTDNVPEALRREVEAILGDEATNRGQIRRNGTLEPIEWFPGVRPRVHFTLMVVSPSLFDLTPAQLASGLLKASSLPFKAVKKTLIDTAFDRAGLEIKELCGEESYVYVSASTYIKGRSVWSAVKSALVEGNPAGVVRLIAGAGFAALEEAEIDLLFDGIDARQVTLGRSYYGYPVPPVFIFADIIGYDRVKPHEYLRQRHVRLAWRLKPEALTGQESYDLTGPLPALPRRVAYLSANQRTRERKTRQAWPRLEGPMGLREDVFTIMPRSQLIRVRLPDDQFREWTRPRPGEGDTVELKALLHAPAETAPGYVAEPLVELSLQRRRFDIQLFPSGIFGEWAEGVDPVSIYSQTALQARPGVLRAEHVRHFNLLAEQNVDRRLTAPITTEYYVRILRNGREVDKIFLNFGPRHKGRPMEGRITHRPNGVAVLTHPAQDPYIIAPHPIEVQPNERDLYPPRLGRLSATGGRLAPGSSWSDPVPVYRMRSHGVIFGHSIATIRVGLAGLDLEPGTYRGTVRLGERTYTMWGAVRSPGGGAAMRCDIPVPVGRHEVTVAVSGVPPRRLIIECEGPDAQALEAVQRRLQQEKELFTDARDAHRRDPSADNAEALSRAAWGLGWALARADRYEEAYELMTLHRQMLPGGADAMSPRAVELLFDAAFRVGDKDGVVWAGQRLAELQTEPVRRKIQEGSPLDWREVDRLYTAMRTYVDTIHRYISVGGDLGTSRHLFRQVIALNALVDYEPKDDEWEFLKWSRAWDGMQLEFPPE